MNWLVGAPHPLSGVFHPPLVPSLACPSLITGCYCCCCAFVSVVRAPISFLSLSIEKKDDGCDEHRQREDGKSGVRSGSSFFHSHFGLSLHRSSRFLSQDEDDYDSLTSHTLSRTSPQKEEDVKKR